jgi:hypothetical protein
MKPFADTLSHEEILTIVRFLRPFEVTAPVSRSEVPECVELGKTIGNRR